MKRIRKIQRFLALCLTAVLALATPVSAASLNHTVVAGDSIWKLAMQYRAGFYDIIEANRQLTNPNLIYPGQVLTIPVTDTGVMSYEAEVVRLVNEIRAQYGLSQLTENWELSRVARMKSQDMHDRRYFDHQSPTYGSPFQMMQSFGISYRAAGENIAMGYRTPSAVVNAWMNSSGHRANILNASYRQIGVGYVSDGYYWTQMFIG